MLRCTAGSKHRQLNKSGMSQPPLFITGATVCTALGQTLSANRDALWNGQDGLQAAPMSLPFQTVVGALTPSPPEIPARWAQRRSRVLRIACWLMSELADEIASVRSRIPAKRIGLVLGTSTGGAERTEEAVRHRREQGQLPSDYDALRQSTCGAILPCLREALGAAGPAWVISTACTSGGKALAAAQRLLHSGAADAVFAGGIDTLCHMTLHGFHSLGALSSTPCRPFSSARDGLNIGEGGALLLLERGGEPLAFLEGVGESSDAHHISAPHPEGRGAIQAMRQALEQAGARPDSVAYINAHGTGTPLNDAAESHAISTVFGDDVPVVSTKSYTGHTLGAAGGVEAVFTLLSITDGFVPPALRCDPIDPAVSIHICTQRREARIRRALSNSFAFGGSNVSLLLGEPR